MSSVRRQRDIIEIIRGYEEELKALKRIISRGAGASTLDELSDVVATGPTNRDAIVWDGVDSWDARPIVEADISDLTPGLTNEELQDLVGAMLTGNTETAITVTYQDGDGTIDFEVPLIDDDTFATATAANLPSAESVKAYVDAAVPPPSQFLTSTVSGTLATGAIPFRWIAPYDITLIGLQAAVTTVATGASIKVDVHDDGITAFSTKCEIAISANDSSSQAPSVASVAAGSVITFEIDQIGSTIAGKDLLVTLEYTVDIGAGAGAQHLTFSVKGELEVGERPFRFIAPYDFTVIGVQTTVGVQPTGASVKIDWHDDGSTLFTDQLDRPEIAVSTNDSTQTVPDTTAVAAGSVLTLGIDQIGSTLPGENLTVIMEITVP